MKNLEEVIGLLLNWNGCPRVAKAVIYATEKKDNKKVKESVPMAHHLTRSWLLKDEDG